MSFGQENSLLNPRSGIAFTDAPLPHEPCAYAELAAGIKRRLDVPVIAVGRIGPSDGERILREGGADFIAMGRKLIADPDLVSKLAEPDGPSARPCIYSYRCVGNVFLRRASTCTVNPAAGRESDDGPAPAARSKPAFSPITGSNNEKLRGVPHVSDPFL